MHGFVHSIETMGLVDGPGTRTIFFLQGCPLRCAYCHNPDTQRRGGGQLLTPEEVLKTVERYRSYYGEEGGVTFSGGEPLLQGEFLHACLQILKREGYNTCVDTSGFGDPRYYRRILPLVDTLLLDVKAFDRASFAELTAVDGFAAYMNFLTDLEENGFRGQIWVRHVMVPGFTDNEESMRRFIELIRPIWKRVDRIEILPYHTSGVEKYARLGLPYRLEGVEPMDKQKAKELEVYANKIFAQGLREERQAYAEKKQEKFTQGRDKAASDLGRSALLSVLRGLPLFGDLAEEDVEDVLQQVILADIKEGEYIFKTGDPPEFMYLIYQGQMKIFVNTMDGEEQIFYIYRDGDFVGGLNLLVQTPYRYIGQALTDCKVVVIPKAAFDKYFYDSPVVLRSVLVKSFERIRWAEDLIQRLATSNASMKTAGLLLKLAKRIGQETQEGIRLELSMNREELGNYSGLRRETITRKLGEFKELGYIELVGNKVIIIKDLEALESYVL
ncbi:MAG: pyruvate formate-lyase-activating protein [Limnochordia bacterium]|jgi:pyruvate formate lyase activating enzyme|nr:pyruvate formate-lyase-activating protein [Limnochordia bacterium]MDI9465468.1 pyruvate formate-lyase-activating protein [Bacillota bacterium]NLO95365.1 pyruvate formate lyase-activating protein [Bacillota bacterium]HAN94720.1 pyruvate formate lyase-activating protein [Bacillota bacterium]HOB40170.1 pyruvate formate-lyase-activating protein [Limnochordia bacterium]